VKDGLLRGLDRIASVRAAIAHDALVKKMPPVEVVGEIWAAVDKDKIMDGCATVLHLKGSGVIGARLPAPTALAPEELLRRILVHEFAHCFERVERTVEALHRGERVVSDHFDVFSASEDADRLGNPADWFGEQDVRALALQGDAELEALTPLANQLVPYLPIVRPNFRYQARVEVPQAFVSRATELLRRRTGNTEADAGDPHS
jgi:hypothetical protein